MKHLPTINIEVIPHSLQFYDTAGNYFFNPHTKTKVHIQISKMNSDAEFMVAAHELIEWYLTTTRGIKEQTITKFDTLEVEPKYENDPGMSPKAPYHKEHLFATRIEKLLAKELGVDWAEYDKSFEKLKY